MIWTSTLKRTIQTACNLPFQSLQWKQLDELSSGSCDGLTYEEIEREFPQDFAERDNDKVQYLASDTSLTIDITAVKVIGT